MSFAYSERRRLLDRALGEVSAAIHGVVLEIGAGRGERRRGRFVPPTDSTSRWLSIDRALAVRPDIAGDAEALPLRDASTDTVVTLEVLEYTTRPAMAMAEMYRVLRPGGHLLISVPFVHRVDAVSDRWRFSEHALREMMERAGFEIVAMKAQGRMLTAVAHLVCSTIAQRPRRAERWLLGALVLPLVALGRLEPFLGRGAALTSATTGYLALGRK